jgi:hypothetical protein
VILSGTMQDGTIVPVQVDAQGRLVAEGLQGATGPQGPQGPAGGSFALPANPEDGKVLGWSNGQLAWVDGCSSSTPPPVTIIPGRGYVPTGNPNALPIYNVLPANGDFNYTADSATQGINNLFDGSISTHIYLTGSDYLGRGDVTEFYIDLLKVLPQVPVEIAVYGAGSGIGYTNYKMELQDAYNRVLSEKEINNPAGSWYSLGTHGAARQLRFYMLTGSSPHCILSAIKVGTNIITIPNAYPDGSNAVPA